jgi:peptidoglycan/xylan/chitin deacetylase (PgdA/CDA1 family)
VPPHRTGWAQRLAPILALRAILLIEGCACDRDNPKKPTIPVSDADATAPDVLVKADDLTYYWKDASQLHPRWIAFFDLIRQEDAKAALGVEGWSLDQGKDGYFQALKSLVRDGRFELYDHGYTHSLAGADSSWQATAEFKGTPYEFQKSHLELTQRLIREKIGVTCIAFGAPGNAVDGATVRAVDEDADPKIWFFGLPGTTKHVISTRSPCEPSPGKPDFDELVAGYRPDAKLLVLQIHPGSWLNPEDLDNFRQIPEFLRSKRAVFITPSEYLERIDQNSSRESLPASLN